MHSSAMLRMKWFVDSYIPKDKEVRVLDIGSYNVNGCYRALFQGTEAKYTGLDVTAGPNVDIVPEDPYKWSEIQDNSFDYVISGNAFEHIEYPWLTIKEIARVLKPGGFICILAPFAHKEHRYPVDCYRYFSDGFIALAKWAELDVVQSSVGGFPEETFSIEWLGENYDDTVLIAGKSIPEECIKKLPKFKCIRPIHHWK